MTFLVGSFEMTFPLFHVFFRDQFNRTDIIEILTDTLMTISII